MREIDKNKNETGANKSYKKTRTKRSIYSPYKEEINKLLNNGYFLKDVYKKINNKYNIVADYTTFYIFVKTRFKKINKYILTDYEL